MTEWPLWLRGRHTPAGPWIILRSPCMLPTSIIYVYPPFSLFFVFLFRIRFLSQEGTLNIHLISDLVSRLKIQYDRTMMETASSDVKKKER